MATAFRTGSPHPGRSAPSWRYADSRSGWIAFVKLLKLSHYTISSGVGRFAQRLVRGCIEAAGGGAGSQCLSELRAMTPRNVLGLLLKPARRHRQ